MSFYTANELKQLQLGSVGSNVLISRKASLYNPQHIHIGNHVRIDDFCVLSAGKGGIYIGNYIHIAVFCSLMGQGKIQLENFSGLSSRVSIYSSNDDYSGHFMTNPTVPTHLTNVTHGNVLLEEHVIVGAGTIILPNVIIKQGAAIGALSLIRKNCTAFGIYFGVPAKRIGERKKDLLALTQQIA